MLRRPNHRQGPTSFTCKCGVCLISKPTLSLSILFLFLLHRQLLRSEKGRTFLKVTYYFSSRGELGLGCPLFSQGYLLSCAGDWGANLLGKQGEWLWCSPHNSIYYLVDVKNNKKINSNENWLDGSCWTIALNQKVADGRRMSSGWLAESILENLRVWYSTTSSWIPSLHFCSNMTFTWGHSSRRASQVLAHSSSSGSSPGGEEAILHACAPPPRLCPLSALTLLSSLHPPLPHLVITFPTVAPPHLFINGLSTTHTWMSNSNSDLPVPSSWSYPLPAS